MARHRRALDARSPSRAGACRGQKIARARGEYRDLHGREPTVEELAELVALPVAAVERCLALGPGVALSLDAPIEDTEGEGDTPLDMLADEDAPSPEDEALRREREGWTRELLDPALLEDVGRRFDMSRERARQIEGDALERMAKRARRAEQKRRPRRTAPRCGSFRRPPSRPPELPPPGPPPKSAPRLRATVAGNAAALEAMREGSSLEEMIRVERALEEAAFAHAARRRRPPRGRETDRTGEREARGGETFGSRARPAASAKPRRDASEEPREDHERPSCVGEPPARARRRAVYSFGAFPTGAGAATSGGAGAGAEGGAEGGALATGTPSPPTRRRSFLLPGKA